MPENRNDPPFNSEPQHASCKVCGRDIVAVGSVEPLSRVFVHVSADRAWAEYVPAHVARPSEDGD